MWSSNLKKSFLFLVFIGLVALGGCFSPDDDNGGAEGFGGNNPDSSDFYVSDGNLLSSKDMNSANTSSESFSSARSQHSFSLWDLNYIHQFSFQVCLTERGSEQEIARQKFYVKDVSGKTIAKGITKRNGCLNWNESVHYNYLAPSHYLKMKRMIVSEKLYKGSTKFHIVINPWVERDRRDGDDLTAFIPEFEGDRLAGTGFVALTQPKEISDALVGKFDARPEDGLLFMKNIRYNLLKANSKITSEFNLRLSGGRLFAKVRKIDGMYKELQLFEGGKYSVMARVLQASATSNREIVPLSLYNPHFSTREDIDVKNSKAITVELPKFYINQTRDNSAEFPLPFHNFSNDGFLEGEIPLSVSNWMETKQFMLLLRVIPEDFPFPGFLKPFEGVFLGGFFTGTSGVAEWQRPDSHKLFKKRGFFNTKESMFSEYMNLNENLSNPNAAPVFHDFDASEVTLNFNENLLGEGITNRGIGFRTTTCLTQKNGGIRPAGQMFKIVVRTGTKNADLNYVERDYDPNSQQERPKKLELYKKANGVGCLSWSDEIWFRHFQPERYMQIVAEISEVGSNSHIELKYRVNPWDEGWTFGKDERTIERKFLAQYRDQKKVSSRIFLPKFGYQTLRFKYNIDKYLNLIVSKQVLFDFAASTLRYNSNRQGRFGVYHLRDGIYMLKAAMEKNYLDPTTTGIWVRNPPEQMCEGYSEEMGVGEETVLKARPECLSTSQFIKCEGAESCRKKKEAYLQNPFLDKKRRPDIRMRRHLDVFSGLVRVVGGKIITPVSFEVKDLRVMRLRSNLFVQIDPVDEWSLWIAKLYSQFYDEVYQGKYKEMDKERNNNQEVYRKNEYFMPEAFHEEKARNIKKMLDKMKGDPRFIHRRLILDQQKERQKTLADDGSQSLEQLQEFNGKKYPICETPDNAFVSWDDVFRVFEISDQDHSLLQGKVGGNLSDMHRYTLGYDNQSVNMDADKRPCLYVYNVIRDLLVNDHSEMLLDPINKIPMAEFIDKDSGLEQTTFFGPMTFLSNGNSSNMRPTKKISEFICPSDSCDESESEANLERALELAVDEYSAYPQKEEHFIKSELNHGERDLLQERAEVEVDDPYQFSDNFILDYLNDSQSNEYEKSPYFGSLAYVNNLLIHDFSNVDDQGNVIPNDQDLESEDKRLKAIEEKENEVRSKVFYYLNNFNLDLVSLGSEKVNYYDPTKQYIYTDLPCRSGDQACVEKNQKRKAECDRDPNCKNSVSCEKIQYVPIETIRDESQCFSAPPGSGHRDLEAQDLLTKDASTINHVRQMIQSLSFTPQLAEKICQHQLKRFENIDFNIVNESLPELVEPKPFQPNKIDGLEPDHRGDFRKFFERNSRKQKKRDELIEEHEAKEQKRKSEWDAEYQAYLEEKKNREMSIANKESLKSLPKLIDVCVQDLVHQTNIDPVKKVDIINGHVLDVERKVRVKQTGSYAFKGGKALNINISDQIAMGYSEGYSFNIGRGVSISDLRKMATGWMDGLAKFVPVLGDTTKWAADTFAMAMDIVLGDRKWSDSKANSRSEGNSISQGTFLVMQNATLDVELTDYIQCVTVTFSKKFMNEIGLYEKSFQEKGEEEPMLVSIANQFGNELQSVKASASEVKQLYMKGLMICDEAESVKALNENYTQKILPVRENFYYFTQHFTEGDMLDTGDLANHPWLKAIRGKTDMWRFLAKIRSQDLDLKVEERIIPYLEEEIEASVPGVNLNDRLLDAIGKKKVPFTDVDAEKLFSFQKERGALNIGDEWPIYQLIKAYHGSLPTFPGVYSAINSPCNYALDFPWGDQAIDSFKSKIDENIFSAVEEDEKLAILESLDNFSEGLFPHEAKSQAPGPVYHSDQKIISDGLKHYENMKTKYPKNLNMTNNFPIGQYKTVDQNEGGFDPVTGQFTGIHRRGEDPSASKKAYAIDRCHGYGVQKKEENY